MSSRTPLKLFIAGLFWHGLWAILISQPIDWDQAYYASVARHIAAGDGAVTQSLWTLLLLPDTLPMRADGYWMPLPSRILVPGLLVWPAHGDRLVAVGLAACWGPAGWWLGREAGLDGRWALAAGLVATLGGPFSGRLPSPDSYAVFGLIGSLGLAGLIRKQLAWVVVSAVLAALCRNDGFLWGLALATGWRAWPALVVAGSGVITAAGWHLRNASVFGDAYVQARLTAANATTYPDLIAGTASPLSLIDRVGFTAAMTPSILQFWALAGGILILVAAPGVWRHRDRPWVQVVALYVIALPLVDTLLAPAAAWHGTLFRSVAAVFPALAALGMAGLHWVNDQAVDRREYPSALLPGVFGVGVAVIAVAAGIALVRAAPAADCAPLAGLDAPVVFSYAPLFTEAHCGRASVVLVRGMDPARVQALADRYDIHHALLAPDTLQDEGSPTQADAPALLPGWSPLSGRLYAKPQAPDPGVTPEW